MDFGWKHKATLLRGVILSSAHQIAKELPPGIVKTLELFKRIADAGGYAKMRSDEETLVQDEFKRISREYPDEPRPLWEPIETHGWEIQATMYLRDGQLWWLVRGSRKRAKEPSEKDVVLLEKILRHLGGDPALDTIISPRSNPPGEERLFFGWWTWRNVSPLMEIQLNKNKRGSDVMRVVRKGAAETDGYQAVDLGKEDREGE